MTLKNSIKTTLCILFTIIITNKVCCQTITIRAKTNPNYNTFEVSDVIKRLLFIKFKGNILLPERGFYLDLSPKDAKKLNLKTIVYIPLNGDEFFGDEPISVNLKVSKLSENSKDIFYSEPDKFGNSIINKNFFINPSKKTIISRDNLYYSENLEFTKQWIDMLGNKTKVIVRGQGCAERTDGEYTNFHTSSEEKLGDLALEKLHYVTNLFTETNPDWSKKKWQQWFANLMAFKEPKHESCNNEVWNMERYFNPSFFNSGRYNTDNSNKTIGIVEALPFYDEYKNQQFIFFDLKQNKSFVYDLHTTDQPFKESVSNFVFDKKQLFILTESFKWFKFIYNKPKNIFEKVASNEILPKDFIKEKERIYITDSYYNNDIYFVVFSKKQEDINQYFVASFKTQTGELIALKSISKVIENTAISSLNDFKFEKLNYCNTDQNYLVLALKNKETKNGYFLKLNPNLEDTKTIKSEIKLDWKEYILTTDTEIVHVRNEYNNLQRYFYSNNLSNFIKNITTEIESDVNLLDNNYIVKDGKNIRVIAEYQGAFNNGLKQEKINIYGNKFEESCVYFEIPVEEINSENEKKLFYVSPNNKGSFTVFFKDNDVLMYVNTK